jgi:hypothetical protein
MTALASNSISTAHVGPCVSNPGAVSVHRDYCLHDFAGRLLGTIAAPERRPEVGPAAPTFYLRRAS